MGRRVDVGGAGAGRLPTPDPYTPPSHTHTATAKPTDLRTPPPATPAVPPASPPDRHAAAAPHAGRREALSAPDRPPKAGKEKPKAKKKVRAVQEAKPVVLLPSEGAVGPPARPPPKKPGKRNKFKQQAAEEVEAETVTTTTSAPPPSAPSRTPTLDRFRERLAAGAFRSLNESLYTRPGAASLAEFAAAPDLFAQYHAGFRAAVAKWPSSPLEAATAFVRTLPPRSSVVDFGCGEAGLATAVGAHARVTSLDLVAAAPDVIACDMAATPLPSSSADAAIFCLALMGTDYPAALAEACRVLKPGGGLWIAEVRSRFVAPSSSSAACKDDVRPFVKAVCGLGFAPVSVDAGNAMFVVLTFRKHKAKGGTCAKQARPPPFPELKPCTYKRR